MDGSSVLSTDDLADYDFVSDGHRSLESSIADLGQVERNARDIQEPPPSQNARENFYTPALSVEEIQDYVKRAIAATGAGFREHESGSGEVEQKVARVYVDGKFDGFNIAHALQLRQAKLSFPLVHLMVGVFGDSVCEHQESPAAIPHLERCELARHCRWVDEVVPEAPWRLDEGFLKARRVDYVAYDEGTSVDPAFNKERLKGYDLVKSLRMTIPTRRTTGVSIPIPERSKTSTPVPSRQGTLRGAPSALKHELLESRSRKSSAMTVRESQTEAPEPFKDPEQELEPEEPKVDEFGTGVGV